MLSPENIKLFQIGNLGNMKIIILNELSFNIFS